MNPLHRIEPQLLTLPQFYGSAGEPTLGALPSLGPQTRGMPMPQGGVLAPMALMGILGGGFGGLLSGNAQAPEVKQPTFDSQFNTILNPQEEVQFGEWKQKFAPHDSGADYDLRGAFKSGLTPSPENGHWADTFKKPNHPTFSDQSNYAQYGLPGRWNGDTYVPHPDAPLDIMSDAMKFGDAFGKARKMGLVQFTWRGKDYTTKLKE